MAKRYSYDYSTLLERSVDEAFFTVVAQVPALFNAVNMGMSDGSLRSIGAFDGLFPSTPSIIGIDSYCTEHKHEWEEDSISAPTMTLTSTCASTTLTIADSTNATAGDLIFFVGATGTSYSEVVQIASVDSGTQCTIVRQFGSSPSSGTIPSGALVYFMGNPQAEGLDAARTGTSSLPTLNYNYTQIFTKDAAVTKTGEAVNKYGVEGALDNAMIKKMFDLAWEMNFTLYKGYRKERTGTTVGLTGAMGGLQQLVTGETDAASAAFSPTILNGAIKETMEFGGSPNVLVLPPNQSQALSAFDTSKVRLTQDDQSRGNAVYQFKSDIAIPGADINKVIVDFNCPRDMAYLLDPSRLALVPMKDDSFAISASELPGGRYFSDTLTGQYTFVVKDGGKCHRRIINLAL